MLTSQNKHHKGEALARLLPNSLESREELKSVLRSGGVAAIPTETVYGLGGLCSSISACQSIFRIKRRPTWNPLIAHLPAEWRDLSDLHDRGLIDMSKMTKSEKDLYRRLVEIYPVGPLTFLLPKGPQVSSLVTGDSPYVAVRRPKNCLMAQILSEIQEPIVAPSANPYQRISPTTGKMVADYYPNIDLLVVDDGGCQDGLESTIISIQEDGISYHRPGSVSLDDLLAAGFHATKVQKQDFQTPGKDLKHYCPQNFTTLLEYQDFQDMDKLLSQARACLQKQKHCSTIGFLSFFPLDTSSLEEHLNVKIICRTLPCEDQLAARLFYQSLSDLDQCCDLILTSKPPRLTGSFTAILDKLIRAIHSF